MSIADRIASARRFLAAGNPAAYARVMSGHIRAAASDRARAALLRAIAEDDAAGHFRGLGTPSPTAV